MTTRRYFPDTLEEVPEETAPYLELGESGLSIKVPSGRCCFTDTITLERLQFDIIAWVSENKCPESISGLVRCGRTTHHPGPHQCTTRLPEGREIYATWSVKYPEMEWQKS